MTRVLYLNPSGILGGAEQSLLILLATLNRSDYSPMIAAMGHGPFGDQAMAMGVPFISLALPERLESLSLRGQRSTWWQALTSLPDGVRMISAVVKQVRKLQPDLIHTNGIKAHVVGTLVGQLMGVRVIWHMRDFLGDGVWERLIVTLGRVGATRIIANSEAVRDSLAAHGLGKQTVAIANGVDLKSFRPGMDGHQIRQEFGIASHTPMVGVIGMLAPWKGQDVFLRAAAVVHAQQPTVRFLIVGDELYRTAGHGSFRQQLMRQVSEFGLQPWVTFTGFRRDMARMLNTLDVVVHASVQPEPFGRVVLEAMACGRPVIATDAGGIPEVLGADEHAGLLVPPGDSAAMAAAILSLLGNERRRQACGQAGRQRAVALFDAQLHAQRVETIYRNLLEGK